MRGLHRGFPGLNIKEVKLVENAGLHVKTKLVELVGIHEVGKSGLVKRGKSIQMHATTRALDEQRLLKTHKTT